MAGKTSAPPRARRTRAKAPTTADPIQLALEAVAASDSTDDVAHRVLRRHEILICWQILKERAGFGLRVLTGLVGVVAAVVVGSLVWDASRERGLVIEPFSVPPAFAEQGVTGQVVASRLLDHLSAMSESTTSVRAPSTYANNWNGDIKVQIPQTGVSVGELRRYLVQWLGRQTTIGGELYQTPTGLALIARTGTAVATPQAGADAGDLDAMIKAAAEQVYATTQPYRHALYLEQSGAAEGAAKSEAALRRLIHGADEADRLWGYAALNLRLQALQDTQGAIQAATAAIAIDPTFNLAYANRAGAYQGAGQSEAAYLDQKAALTTAGRHGHRHMREEGLVFVQQSWAAAVREAVGDYAGATSQYEDSLRTRPDDAPNMVSLLLVQAAAHDEAAARRTLAQLVSQNEPTATASEMAASIAGAEALMAYHRQDWPQVVAQTRASMTPGAPVIARSRVESYPSLAIALAHVGDFERAATIIGGTPTNCYRCAIARGVIAELSGDTARADRWLAAAVTMAPSLPFALEERGRVRLARGDTAGALADFREANRRSPRFAEALKGWGDALAAQGDRRGAVRKYEAALRLTPQWPALRQALEQARAT